MLRPLSYLFSTTCIFFASLVLSPFSGIGVASAQEGVKEWTLLVFLNGNNNLDRFGALNINQMEKVGSTSDINIVVQWASWSRDGVQRLLVNKDTDTENVTSPVVENIGKVDMGD